MKIDLVARRTRRGRRVELMLDGRAVSWAELFYLRLRVGRAVFGCGGIGDVFTRRGHRNRGYSRRVLERCIEVTDLQGVHSGANAASGEFSLQAQGFAVERGARVRPVHNFTVAGSFLEMLARVAAVADDFKFSHFPVGAPTVLVSELAVAGGGS